MPDWDLAEYENNPSDLTDAEWDLAEYENNPSDLTDAELYLKIEGTDRDHPLETLPIINKVSPTACMGGRITRAGCPCCGGHVGVRRARRRLDNHANREAFEKGTTLRDRANLVTRGRKPRHKDHRN